MNVNSIIQITIIVVVIMNIIISLSDPNYECAPKLNHTITFLELMSRFHFDHYVDFHVDHHIDNYIDHHVDFHFDHYVDFHVDHHVDHPIGISMSSG